MQAVVTIVRIMRNIYVVVMMLPLWAITAYYRYVAELPSSTPQSMQVPWLLSLLVFVYGVAVLSIYIERLEEKRHRGEKTKGVIVRLIILFFLLALSTTGSILINQKIALGQALFWVGTVILPITVLIMFTLDSGDDKKKKEEPQA